MDFIKDSFKEHEGALIEQLKVAGFSVDQAKQFLPEAATGILDSTQDAGVEQITKRLLSGDPSELSGSVDIAAIAAKLGIDSDQVTKGLAAIAPILARVLSQKGGGLLGAVSSFAPGLFK
jgi:hypothetical protein